jgi:hypothetical protein
MAAIFPSGIASWVNRINNVNVVWAADPNFLATEIIAIETYIGENPQIEPSPPIGKAVTYSSLSARVTAAMNNANMIGVSMLNDHGFFIQAGQQLFNSYPFVRYDPYKIWNGTDLTIPVNGWWSIRADQRWNQKGNNFHGQNILFLYVNGAWVDMEIWDWSNTIAANPYNYPANVLASNGWTKLVWMGLLHKGDRVQLLSANGTFCPGIQVTNCTLKAVCLQTLPTTTNFVSA